MLLDELVDFDNEQEDGDREREPNLADDTATTPAPRSTVPPMRSDKVWTCTS
jgi:hypothetical protein